MHDPVPRRDHLHVGEGALGPLDEVEAVFVAAVFDLAVLREGIGVEAAALHGQRMVDDELHGHHGVHLRRVAAFGRDRIAQAGQIDQRGLAQDVVAHHAHRIPRKVAVAPPLDELHQAFVEDGGLAFAHQVFGMHARRVGQRVPGAGAQRVDGGAGVDVVECGAGERCSVSWIHSDRMSLSFTTLA